MGPLCFYIHLHVFLRGISFILKSVVVSSFDHQVTTCIVNAENGGGEMCQV